MELVLERSDLLQVGTVSYRNTMKLLHGGKSGRARICVGDDHGYVECFEIKKGEPTSVFKQRARGGVRPSVRPSPRPLSSRGRPAVACA